MRIVVEAKNGTRDFTCEPGEKILHAGLRSGVELPYECATGTCGTCKARLVSGRTESEWPEAPGRRYLKGEAEVGDEQKFEDPTVNQLCEMVADLLGKEAAVFLPSGTMCNEIALRVHCRPGSTSRAAARRRSPA